MNGYNDFRKFAGLFVFFFLLIFWFACYMGGISLAEALTSFKGLLMSLDSVIMDGIAQVIAGVK